VAITHVAVLGAALLTLLCLPCAVAMLVAADQLAIRRAWIRRGRRDARLLRRLDRHLTLVDVVLPLPGPMPCIEQIAADLRRLDRQRRSETTACSELWLTGVVRAYDERLQMASQCLGVPEHLDGLEGVDRDIERVRVETELESAGLSLRSRS
jgi:hypothetical protein